MSRKNDIKTVPQFLKRKRAEAGLTQKELANKMGYSTAQFCSNWERSKSLPPIGSLKKLATILDFDVTLIKNLIILDKIEKLKSKLITK